MVTLTGDNGEHPLTNISSSDWIGHFALSDNYELANALADAWNISAWLGSELDEDDCPEVTRSRYNEWRAMTLRLIRLSAERCGNRSPLEELKPYRKTITVFMEQHGFHDGDGWWIRNCNCTNNENTEDSFAVR